MATDNDSGQRSTDNGAILASLAVINNQLKTLHEDFREMKILLKGDGDTPGLQIRVDRLEQAANKNNMFHMLWAGSVISAFVGWIITKIT